MILKQSLDILFVKHGDTAYGLEPKYFYKQTSNLHDYTYDMTVTLDKVTLSLVIVFILILQPFASYIVVFIGIRSTYGADSSIDQMD